MKSWLAQKLSHLGRMELGFAYLLPASPVSEQEEVIQKPQKLQCGSSVLEDFGSFVLQLSAFPQL